MFYRVIKEIYQFAANLLSYIPAKYYWNRSTSDLVIAKSRRVNFLLKHSVVTLTLFLTVIAICCDQLLTKRVSYPVHKMLWQQKLCFCGSACVEQFAIVLVAGCKVCFGNRSFATADWHVWKGFPSYLLQDISSALVIEALLLQLCMCGTVCYCTCGKM